MSVMDGPSCPGCGLPNYEGLCPHCRGDQDAYERELVPPFDSSLPPDPASVAAEEALNARLLRVLIDEGLLHHGARGDEVGPDGDYLIDGYNERVAQLLADAARSRPASVEDWYDRDAEAFGRAHRQSLRPASVEGERRSATVDRETRAEAAAAWVAGWFARENAAPFTTHVSDDDVMRLGREYAAALPASTESGSRVDVERLLEAMGLVWPSHAEGSMSSPPSGHDATWQVPDPALPTRWLAEQIAAEYLRPSSSTEQREGT